MNRGPSWHSIQTQQWHTEGPNGGDTQIMMDSWQLSLPAIDTTGMPSDRVRKALWALFTHIALVSSFRGTEGKHPSGAEISGLVHPKL